MPTLFPRTIAKLASRQQTMIVALGDSNTELTWHTAGRLNVVGLLQEALFEKFGRNTAFLINAGKCGDTAERSLDRLDRDVLRFKPDLVLIAFGMNDGMTGPKGVDAHVAATRAIVERCRAAGAEVLIRTSCPIVVVNCPLIPPGGTLGEAWPGMHQGLYAQRLVQLAKEMNCPIVDHYTLWVDSPRPTPKEDWNHLWPRMSDPFHPNAVGHLAFYRELAPLFDLPRYFGWEIQ